MDEKLIMTIMMVVSIVMGMSVSSKLLGYKYSNEPKKVWQKESSNQIEQSLAGDYRSDPKVIRNAKGLSVYKKDNELSRTIEPNHRVNGLNGLELK